MTEDELMLTTILDCRRVDLFVDPQILSREQKIRFEKMRERRANGEPLQYIFGQCDFMGTKLTVNQQVLIPRPETEELVDSVLKHFEAANNGTMIEILDLGTGSGNIAITLAKNISHCHVMALDNSRGALEVARTNAEINKVTYKIDFIETDMVCGLAKSCSSSTKRSSVFSKFFCMTIILSFYIFSQSVRSGLQYPHIFYLP